MIADLAALALICAPNIHPITLHTLISHESRARQYAIGVNRKGKHLRQQPRTLTEATEAAQRLIDQGINSDAGLGQINVRNWAWLNLDTKTVFDPCRNLAAAQTVLAEWRWTCSGSNSRRGVVTATSASGADQATPCKAITGTGPSVA